MGGGTGTGAAPVIAKAARDPGFIAQLKSTGTESRVMLPAEFKTYLQAEMRTLRRDLPPLGIQLDL